MVAKSSFSRNSLRMMLLSIAPLAALIALALAMPAGAADDAGTQSVGPTRSSASRA
jgi:hypothetical protein